MNEDFCFHLRGDQSSPSVWNNNKKSKTLAFKTLAIRQQRTVIPERWETYPMIVAVSCLEFLEHSARRRYYFPSTALAKYHKQVASLTNVWVTVLKAGSLKSCGQGWFLLRVTRSVQDGALTWREARLGLATGVPSDGLGFSTAWQLGSEREHLKNKKVKKPR